MIYLTQSDWFEKQVRPRAIRRAIVAFVVSAAVFVSAVFLRSIPAGVVSAVALLFGIFDIVQLKSAKAIVRSLKVSVSEQGLCFIFGPKQTEVLYPWRSLKVSRIKRRGNEIVSFVVSDLGRKRSHVSVMGYENMGSLFAAVQSKVGNA